MAAVAAIAVASAAVLCGSMAGAFAGIEPFATWLYPLAWYPTLALLEAAGPLKSRIRAGT